MRICKNMTACLLTLALLLPVYAADGGDAGVKRGEAIRTLYEREGSPAVIQSVAFPDAAGTEYANAAVWAKGAGIVYGDGDGLVHGERAVTRAELAAMLCRLVRYRGAEVSMGENARILTRSDMPGWAVNEMAWAFSNGVLQEKEGGALDAWGAVTAGELAEALEKAEALTKRPVVLGDEQFDEYVPLLDGKRVALFSNHTGIVGNRTSVSDEMDFKGADLVQLGLDRNGGEIT